MGYDASMNGPVLVGYRAVRTRKRGCDASDGVGHGDLRRAGLTA